jgi:osmoprotectant transport system permease protein
MNIVTQTAAWLSDPIHWSGPNGIPVRLFEHVIISGISLAIALAIALPIGLYIGHTGRHTNFAVNSANLWRALPSLAVIAIVLPLTTALDPQLGFKVYPTVLAMVVLAVPPILVNAYAGLAGVDRDMLEAARGQGMSERQILRRVELPLAVPVIATGIRSAAIQVVATATLGAVFGFGGLGRYLVDGISQNDTGQIMGGVVLVALLVVVAELLIALIQRGLTPRGLRLETTASRAQSSA